MARQTVAYYDATAEDYDAEHGDDPEHVRALELAWPILGFHPQSVLDVGCGTGRGLRWSRQRAPGAALFGIDPSEQLLRVAKAKIPDSTLFVGYGEQLDLADASIDVVIACGIMHHVDDPSAVIGEMFRVARKAVLISDHNNFAFGGQAAQRMRMLLYCCGLLGLATFIKQGFCRQGYSAGDGWWYPYSIMGNFGQISRSSAQTYLLPTRRATPGLGGNLVFCQSHVAVLALKC
jgi:SAM-dependent methyltransferase